GFGGAGSSTETGTVFPDAGTEASVEADAVPASETGWLAGKSLAIRLTAPKDKGAAEPIAIRKNIFLKACGLTIASTTSASGSATRTSMTR
ncbi:hypothetical protein, partial [Mesorhizobium sp.]|uniref:hypothetical protein n=1 Tax=Mesorhizobium sp. TaxID=1871066 RepID=UPI0025C6F113